MVAANTLQPRFATGRLLATPTALRAMEQIRESPMHLIDRHRCGDWGQLDGHDAAYQTELLNHEGTDRQERMISQYTFDDITLWVITEADRSATTILLPEEY